jgi:hypothetical protein
MGELQRIVYRDQLAAVVLADVAIIDDTLADSQHRLVQAMCLYALEVRAGQRSGPYSDQAAELYAREALAETR